jgi:hypothetical protein
MRSFVRLIVAGSLVFVSTLALAAQPTSTSTKDVRVRYRWTDAQGSLHFADAIPPEAARLGYEVVNSQGLVVKRVDRARTPEELAAAKAEAERKAEAARVANEAARNDAQMLAAYPTEDDLRKALQAQIDLINQNISATEIGIVSQEKSLAERLIHAAELERNGTAVPAVVQHQITTLKDGITEQKAFLVRRQSDKIAMQKQLETDLARYRDLRRRVDDERKEANAAK